MTKLEGRCYWWRLWKLLNILQWWEGTQQRADLKWRWKHFLSKNNKCNSYKCLPSFPVCFSFKIFLPCNNSFSYLLLLEMPHGRSSSNGIFSLKPSLLCKPEEFFHPQSTLMAISLNSIFVFIYIACVVIFFYVESFMPKSMS